MPYYGNNGFIGKTRSLALWLSLTVLYCFSAQLQAAYVFQTVPGEAFDSVSTNVVWNNNPAQTNFPTDDDYQLLNIGFTFYLGETAYTQLRLLSNGALHFGADQGFYKDYTNEALPITNDCNSTGSPCPGFEEPADRTILGYWDDLEPSLGGTVRYGVLGSAPNRRFVASWENVPRFNGAGTSYSFQIVLYEDGSIRYRYGNDLASGSSATIGIEISDSDFTQYSFGSNSVNDATDILWTRELPTINSVTASCTNNNKVTVNFNSAVSPVRATNPANYTINNGIAVTSASLINSTTVELTTTTLSSAVTYTLSTSIPNQSVNFQLGTPTNHTFIDQFTTVAYSNNNGTDNWAGNWIESDDNNLAGSGSVVIGSGVLFMSNLFGIAGQPRVEREVDLTDFTTASFSFDYGTFNNLEGNDRFDVAVSSDGGANYTVLRIYRNDVSGSDTFDISGFISNNTRIRLRIRRGYTGGSEYIFLDNVTISGTKQSPCAPSIDHYRIEHDGSGVTCERENIVLKACTNTACSALSSDSVSLDFQADGVTRSSPTFVGSTTIPLVQTTPDTLTLSIANPSISPANPLVCVSGSGNSCDIVFTNTGFKFYGDGTVDNIGNQIAAKPSNVAPGNQSITLRAIQTNPATGRCDALITNSSANIGFAYQCNSPSSCAIPTNAMAINGSQTVDQVTSGYTAINVNFDATGTGTLNLNYIDAGQITLLANADLAVGSTTVNVQGNSNLFWVRPEKLIVTAQSAGTHLNNNTDAGLPRHKAGANFSLVVSALNVAGNVTPNYSPGQIQFLLNRTGPSSGGSDGTFNYAAGNNITSSLTPTYQNVALTSFSSGISSYSSASYSEVGHLNLDLRDNNYGLAGINIPGDSINIGRFYPDHFIFRQLIASNSCGTFTYGGYLDGSNPGLNRNGQAFMLSGIIEAKNTGGQTTANYIGNFIKFNKSNISATGFDNTTSTPINTLNFATTPATLTLTDNNNGTFNFSETNAHYQFNSQRQPLNLIAQFSLSDSDGVIATGSRNSNVIEQRLGRLLLLDAYGPEISPLELKLKTEYFDGSQWRTNSNDSCTQYQDTLTSFQAGSYTDQLSAGETTAQSTGGLQNLTAGLSGLSNGIWFSAPGANNYGSVQVNFNLASQPWLQYDWNGDNLLDTTHGILSFGYYRGSDRVIYWREVRN